MKYKVLMFQAGWVFALLSYTQYQVIQNHYSLSQSLQGPQMMGFLIDTKHVASAPHLVLQEKSAACHKQAIQADLLE